MLKVFQVISSNILLNETSGHVMFSANNLSEHHAFDLLIPESVSYYDSTAHIFDITDSSTTILRRRWETFSDIEFAKSNNFSLILPFFNFLSLKCTFIFLLLMINNENKSKKSNKKNLIKSNHLLTKY